jgi:biopolymer transport protein ExbD
MAVSLFDDDDHDHQPLAAINTTPLVDVMLVLLIIFLITVPVVTHSVPVNLPREANQPARTRPQTVTIAVDRGGQVFWNQEPVADMSGLDQRMKVAALQDPQPEVHIRGDQDVPYRSVGRVVEACRRAGIVKLAFITEPPDRNP